MKSIDYEESRHFNVVIRAEMWEIFSFFLEDWHDQMSDICFFRLESNHFPTMDVIRHLKIKHLENYFGIPLEEMGFEKSVFKKCRHIGS